MVLGLLQNPGSIHIPILFLSLLFATHFGKKQGDFGILTSCSMKDGRLRFDCSYPPCDDSTPFQCDFTNEDGDLLGSSTQLVFRNDAFFEDKNRLCQLYVNINWTTLVKPTNYTCTLTRRRRKEVKNVTLEYMDGRGIPKPCPSAAVLLHEASGLLWLMALLPTTLKILF